MSAEANVVYWLEPLPSGVSEHLHKCPIPGCGHEMILRSRDSDDESPEMCWCGAPLPQSERVVFLTSDIEENRAEAVRIMHWHQGIEQDEAEATA
jgi:hypothetical protein